MYLEFYLADKLLLSITEELLPTEADRLTLINQLAAHEQVHPSMITMFKVEPKVSEEDVIKGINEILSSVGISLIENKEL